MPPKVFFGIAIAFVIVCAFCLIAAFRFAPPGATWYDNFTKGAGILIPAVGVIFTVGATAYNQYYTAKITKANEAQKAQATLYQELYDAALNSYHFLKRKAGRDWQKQDGDTLDVGMKAKASSTIRLTDEAHRKLWYEIWQQSNFIGERFAILTPEKQTETWNNEGPELANLIAQFEKLTKEKCM